MEAYASYDVVREKFNGYFVHPVNEVYESSRLHKRNQLPGETVDAFYTVLKNMVKKCNYPLTVEDRLVRDRFVVGLLNSRLSDQLCRVSKLTLQDALTQARQHEDTEKEKQARSSQANPFNIDALGKQQASAHSSDASQRCSRPEDNQQRVSLSASCDYCGYLPHSRQDCPPKKATCNLCHKRGHFAAVCRSRKKRLSHIELLAVNASCELGRFVSVEVDGRALRFKVDSGADVSVFSKLDAQAGFHQVRLSESSQEYTTFITPFGRYCYSRLPFGITSAPEVFQRQMYRILEGTDRRMRQHG
ncbi:uncharacterized protein LOC125756397 [Rhipicephalus sanguineus]|uniref:uncharacterized protein LOC125756397 n=1 Tax=Rhipicephalus sanguineus TaxID=34632 RepID=UPI0020C5675B|nr:uncharacterized protein LOC125756397 [Rhipicephalus sanguineus]